MDKNNCIENPSFEYTLNIFVGKWKIRIVYWLGKKEVLRYGELKKLLPNITHKVLSQQLKELESDKIINRNEYPQVPPKVEYTLTEKGIDFIPLIKDLCTWAKKNRDDV